MLSSHFHPGLCIRKKIVRLPLMMKKSFINGACCYLQVACKSWDLDSEFDRILTDMPSNWLSKQAIIV